MIPILYDSTETSFMTNGIARLRDCISCQVTEERNGVYECDFEYPVDGAHFEDIIPGRIIAVTHDESGDVQPFDIVSYSKSIDGIASFHAVHISYRQSFLAVTGSNINSLADAFNLLATASPTNPFTYQTDITSTAYLAGADGTPKTVRQLLGGSEGSILDAYGGEYEFDRFSVDLWKNRGQNRDFLVRYGVNMTDYNDDADYFGSFTSCIPYWNGEGDPVVGSKVDSGLISYNGVDLCIPLDLTDKFEAAPSVSALESAALTYMTSSQSNIPAQTIRIDFLRLQDYSGYEDFENLLACNLCDTISVEFPQYGMTGSYKIVRIVYDVLEGRYIEMELGALRTSLSEALGITGSVMSSGHGGADGKSAYQYAVEAGYTGTEQQFALLLAQIPDDSTLVHKSGTETITGAKTFTQPIVGTVSLTQGIPFGQVDSTSTNTAYTATVDGITELKNGVCCYLRNGVVNSASGFTLNINGLGAKPVYSSMATSTRQTTQFNVAYTFLFVYNEDRVSGGCWDLYYGYDSNSNTIGYQLRTNSTALPVTDTARYYKMYFTSADNAHWVPASVNSSSNATTARAVNQRPINPFGRIVYTTASTNFTAGSNLTATTLWDQYVFSLGYSFNVNGGALALTTAAPVFLKCTPQSDGSAIIDATTPCVQELPSSEDGKIYIYLGIAYSATNIELFAHHPIYQYKNGAIRPWVNEPVDTVLSSTSSNPLANSTIHAELSALAERLELRSPAVYFDTVAGWNAQTTLQTEDKAIYVYTDLRQTDDNKNVAGIKIGDGNAYLIDKPFLDEIYYDHINDTDIHITSQERAFWNNKVTAYYSLTDVETLVLSKNAEPTS